MVFVDHIAFVDHIVFVDHIAFVDHIVFVTTCGRKRTLVTSLECFIEITPDFLCPFCYMHSKFQSHSYWQSLDNSLFTNVRFLPVTATHGVCVDHIVFVLQSHWGRILTTLSSPRQRLWLLQGVTLGFRLSGNAFRQKRNF